MTESQKTFRISHTLLSEPFEITGTAFFIHPGSGNLIIANGSNRRKYNNYLGKYKVELL